MPAAVDFIIATYKRTDALRYTLRSLVLQEFDDWSALVIGDHCGEETAEAIKSIGDPRIRYYNLPYRCGEQSGPNSVGLKLATAEFVGFLNHDDLLLPDHLTQAMARRSKVAWDVYIGCFADVDQLESSGDGAIPVVSRTRPRDTNLNRLISWKPYWFDPSSFSLIRTEYAQAVGAWRPAATIQRTPLRDWLLRAWSLGGHFAFGQQVTGIRVKTKILSGARLYDRSAVEQAYFLDRMHRETPADIRQVICHPAISQSKQQTVKLLLTAFGYRILASPYRYWGIDPVSLWRQIARRPKGQLLKQLSSARTGEALPTDAKLDEFLKAPESYRVI